MLEKGELFETKFVGLEDYWEKSCEEKVRELSKLIRKVMKDDLVMKSEKLIKFPFFTSGKAQIGVLISDDNWVKLNSFKHVTKKSEDEVSKGNTKFVGFSTNLMEFIPNL